MTLLQRFSALLGAIPLLVACSSGDGGGDGGFGISGAAYTKTCAKTACESCRDDVADACSECQNICSSPYADLSCFSTCRDICGTSCRACTGSDSCLEWEVQLPTPQLDQTLYDACLAARNACTPTDYDASYCNYLARTMKPSTADSLACLVNNACDVSKCDAPTDAGTLGIDFCARAAQCGKPCKESEPGFLNSIEHDLRPELLRSMRQCIAEDICSVFEACGAAHENLWQLAWEKADPGTDSACTEAWLNECGTCECGFTCVKSCSTCAARCVDPCTTDADCIGKRAGILETPHCFGANKQGDIGYCEPKPE